MVGPLEREDGSLGHTMASGGLTHEQRIERLERMVLMLLERAEQDEEDGDMTGGRLEAAPRPL